MIIVGQQKCAQRDQQSLLGAQWSHGNTLSGLLCHYPHILKHNSCIKSVAWEQLKHFIRNAPSLDLKVQGQRDEEGEIISLLVFVTFVMQNLLDNLEKKKTLEVTGNLKVKQYQNTPACF